MTYNVFGGTLNLAQSQSNQLSLTSTKRGSPFSEFLHFTARLALNCRTSPSAFVACHRKVFYALLIAV